MELQVKPHLLAEVQATREVLQANSLEAPRAKDRTLDPTTIKERDRDRVRNSAREPRKKKKLKVHGNSTNGLETNTHNQRCHDEDQEN